MLALELKFLKKAKGQKTKRKSTKPNKLLGLAIANQRTEVPIIYEQIKSNILKCHKQKKYKLKIAIRIGYLIKVSSKYLFKIINLETL